MPAGWTATPAYHPEFGLLSPYARRRRGIPLPLLLIAGGIAVSGTIGFAAEHWGDGQARTTIVQRTEAPSAKKPDICATGDDASFLSSICGPNGPHAKHGAHGGNRFSTVVLGRTSLPPEHLAAVPSATPAGEPSEKAQNEKVEKTAPERTAAAKKARARSRATMLAAQARELDRQNGFDAFAWERRPGLAYAPRPTAPRWSYDTPFRPSW
jgi:hypothetical protein